MTRLGILAVVAAVFTTAGAHATVITFEDQPASACCFGSVTGPTTITETPLTGVTVTFSGGVILTNENAATDTTNVYATASPRVGSTVTGANAGYGNPLTMTFNQPLQDFSLQILNALAGNYELKDNAGNTDFFSLATTGNSVQTEGFLATGTVVQLLYLSGGTQNVATQWDFAIDNVSFDLAPSTVPEPATWAMLLLGLAGLAAGRRKAGLRRTA